MANDLKNRTRKMFSIDKKLVELLEALSKTTRIPQSRLMDEAIEDLLEKYRGKDSSPGLSLSFQHQLAGLSSAYLVVFQTSHQGS